VMAVGAIMRLTGLFKDEAAEGVNNLILYVAMPSMMIMSMQRDYDTALLGELGWVFITALGVHLASGLIGYLIFRRQPSGEREPLILITIFSNCAYIGFPLITATFGEHALIDGAMYSLAFNLCIWTLGVAVCVGRMEPRRLLTPGLLAVLAGLALFLLRIRLPVILSTPLNLLGALTVPLAMLLIGVRMVNLRPRQLLDARVYVVSALRLLALPALTFAILTAFGLPAFVVRVVTLLCAAPGGTIAPILAAKHRCGPEYASQLVAITTLISLITLPLLATVLGGA